jgi:hypothetical protein
MSRYYVNKKFRIKRIRRIYDDMRPFERNKWRRRLDKYWRSTSFPCDFSRSPSRWNSLHSTRPARHKEYKLLASIDPANADYPFNWPDYRKPSIFFW